MRTNPEPDDLVSTSNSDGAVAKPDSHGVDRLLWMDLLKTQTWMIRVFGKEFVGALSLALSRLRKFLERFSKTFCGM